MMKCWSEKFAKENSSYGLFEIAIIGRKDKGVTLCVLFTNT